MLKTGGFVHTSVIFDIKFDRAVQNVAKELKLEALNRKIRYENFERSDGKSFPRGKGFRIGVT